MIHIYAIWIEFRLTLVRVGDEMTKPKKRKKEVVRAWGIDIKGKGLAYCAFATKRLAQFDCDNDALECLRPVRILITRDKK